MLLLPWPSHDCLVGALMLAYKKELEVTYIFLMYSLNSFFIKNRSQSRNNYHLQTNLPKTKYY